MSTFEKIKDQEIDLLENNIRRFFHELNSKQSLLNEANSQLSESLVKSQSIEWDLQKATKDLKEIKIQLEVSVAASTAMENERIKDIEQRVQQTVQLDVLKSENSSLQNLVKTLEVENHTLQNQLKQKDSLFQSHKLLKEDLKAREEKLQNSLQSVERDLIELRKMQIKLKKVCIATVAMSREATTRFCQQISNLDRVTRERNELKDELNKLTAQLKGKTTPETEAQPFRETERAAFIQEWKEVMKQNELRLSSWEDQISSIHSSLNSALESISKLDKSVSEQKPETESVVDG